MNKKIFQWNNQQICYYDKGEGNVLFFIHAFPLNADMWLSQINGFSEEYRTIALDLPGFGDTPAFIEKLTMESAAQLIVELMDYLEIASANIIGLSMGGYIAMEFTKIFPDKVEQLVLANTRARADTEAEVQKRLQTANEILNKGKEQFKVSMVKQLLGEHTLDNNPTIVDLTRRIIDQSSSKGIAAALKGMAERTDNTELLSSISLPVLVIESDQDTLITNQDIDDMVKAIKNVKHMKISRCGHISSIEQPDQFNQGLLHFLQSKK